MLLKVVKRYLLQFVFVLSLLVGLQIPNFLNTYQQRLDGHYLEAKSQLVEYQKLADLYFASDLQALIDKHKASDDKLFVDEAKVIERLVGRIDFLAHQKTVFEQGMWEQFLLLSGQVNSPLFVEARRNYQAEVVLNQKTITVGMIIAFVLTLLSEFLLLLLPLPFRFFYRRFKATTPQPSA